MSQALNELVEIASRHARGRRTATSVRSLVISRSETPTRPASGLCRQAVLFVLQGGKCVMIGNRVLRYDPGSYFVYAVEAPTTSQLTVASATRPYLAIALALDVRAIAALLVDHASTIAGDTIANDLATGSTNDGFVTHPIDDELLDALRRMVRLLDRPAEIPVLAPMLEREILFRLLRGPQGAKLHQLARRQGHLYRVRMAIAWIRAHYDQPIQVAQLAELARMSSAAFHRHFKAATAMTPIQYQKRVRLLAARQLLIAEPGNVARVAFAVGYESASQFSREYARQFGCSPARDAARFRSHSPVAFRHDNDGPTSPDVTRRER